ncbi:mitochondrial inner membrane protease ATP23 homolog isoform X1 [Bombina bombina]|uniref:mitochondrial inner membrane protease ATP23 homolog isoform X1 n=1 Tax=Bombina bombina TaxID=8345 RepID=UPI00235B2EFF|nr:mitochondrial inner membrane protease ATP23 homolog isoform X1 [Bombina bombina]
MEEEKNKPEDELGYHLFPERHNGVQKIGLLSKGLLTFNHKCQVMLKIALDTSPYAKLLLDAMKQSGCTVYKDRHFSCEECDGSVSGGFDAATSEIVLCQNNIRQQSHMNRVVTHELIHAFDHCRAHVDWFNNVKHLACSEIRAANLSGDCSLGNELTRFKFGVKEHHQVCVRDRALRSILAVRKVSREDAEKAVDEVFDSCFNDHEPFGRIPHSKKDAKYAYRDFQNRDRYYANL